MTIRLNVCAILVGWCGLVIHADAQQASAPPASGARVAMAPAADSSSDQQVKQRVEAALLAAKYSLETHVDVSVEKGAVVLSGFVLSEWDRRHAIEITRQEAGGRKIIDEIHLKEGQAR